MQPKGIYHIPALLNETIELLAVKPGKKYLDATLGGGGHSEAILKAGGELLAIDRDPQAIEFAETRLKTACPASPFQVVRSNFSRLSIVAKENGFEKFDGILFDLGVSSHQLDTAERGFSFNLEGPLDMRMDPDLAVAAKDLVNVLNEGELSELFSKLGEEALARRYAKAICEAKKVKPIEKSTELSEIISRANPGGKFSRINPSTKVFQALRIAVNDELNSLKEALPQAVELLNKEGRLVIISFHSLEDGIVKRFFNEMESTEKLKIVTNKPIEPTQEETRLNPRARSAKLRAAERI